MAKQKSNSFLDVVDNKLDFIKQVVEKSIDQSVGMALRPGSVAYRYAKVNTEVVLHVRCRSVEFNRRDFCAVFHVALMGDECHSLAGSKARDTIEFSFDRLADGQLEQPVFVRIVEVAQDGKERREFRVRSIVRLNILDCCSHTLAERSNAPLLPLIREVGGSVTDRKLKDASVQRGITITLNDSNSVEELIQSAPKIVNTISRDQSPTDDRGRFGDIQGDAKTSSLGITLSEQGVRTTFHPSPDLVLDGISVFTRPFELEVNSTKDNSG